MKPRHIHTLMCSPHQQRGAGLLVAALFMLIVIGLMGAVSVRMASTDIADTALQNNSVEALFLAESGAERALQRLAAGTACTSVAQAGTRFTLGRGDFELQTSVLNATTTWCDVTILGRVLLNGTVSAQRQTVVSLQPPSGSAAAAWTVGSGGAVYAWSGSSWSAGTSNTTQQLNRVHCVNATNCWAVGTGGVIRHWAGSGTNWTTPATTGTVSTNELRSVACIPGDAAKCYAVGNSVSWRWNGTNWATFTPPSTLLRGISCTSTACFAVDDQSRIWNLNITTNVWSLSTTPSSSQSWNAIHCQAGGECWAVGAKSSNNFTFARRDTTTPFNWNTLLFNSPPAKDLFGIHCTSSDNCWAVGESHSVIQRIAGGYTRFTFAASTTLRAVHCSAVNNCLAVGLTNSALLWNGAAWSDASSGLLAGTDFYGVAMTGATGGTSVAGQLMRWREIIL